MLKHMLHNGFRGNFATSVSARAVREDETAQCFIGAETGFVFVALTSTTLAALRDRQACHDLAAVSPACTVEIAFS